MLMMLLVFYLCVLSLIAGNHAIGTVRKFPTLPLNSNGVWIDPTGGVWRKASGVKEQTGDYGVSGGCGGGQNGGHQVGQHQMQPDYER